MSEFSVVVNDHAGTVIGEGPEAVRDHLVRALPPDTDILFLPPERIDLWLRENADKGPVLIGGGDGTITQAASVMMESGGAFGVLPMGTMNLFAKDLGLLAPYTDIAAGYRDYTIEKVDAGVVNGHLFLCNTIVGMADEMVKIREERREDSGPLKWASFFKELVQRMAGDHTEDFTLSYGNQTHHFRAKALIVSNNHYLETGLLEGAPFQKESLQDGRLAVYALAPDNKLKSLLLLGKIALGRWATDKDVKYFTASSVTVEMPQVYFEVAVDGELVRMTLPLEFSILPEALRLLIPRNITQENP